MYVGTINVSNTDIDRICSQIAQGIDAPGGYYLMSQGEGANSNTWYYRINNGSFCHLVIGKQSSKLFMNTAYLDPSQIVQYPTGNVSSEIVIQLDLSFTVDTLTELLASAISGYLEHSGTNPFGCCSKYMECSDQLQCVTQDKAIRYDCIYRRNLLAGKVFYGKNRNIDLDG